MAGIKIGKLSEKSSIPPSTIRYYVKEGLLPEPRKVNKAMAYYDESCIERLQTIRYLQENKHFSLSMIKNILKRMEQGLALEEAEAIEDVVFDTHTELGNSLIRKEVFLLRTGLTSEELNEAEKVGLLIPYIHEKNEMLYNHEDVRFGRDILRRILQRGIAFNEFAFYVELGKKIIEQEMCLRQKVVKNKPIKDNIEITTELSSMADFMRSYILKRLFQREVHSKINRGIKKNR